MDKHLKKDAERVSSATGTVQNLLEEIRIAKEKSIGLSQDFADIINFYTEQRKILENTVKFCEKILD